MEFKEIMTPSNKDKDETIKDIEAALHDVGIDDLLGFKSILKTAITYVNRGFVDQPKLNRSIFYGDVVRVEIPGSSHSPICYVEDIIEDKDRFICTDIFNHERHESSYKHVRHAKYDDLDIIKKHFLLVMNALNDRIDSIRAVAL